MKKNILSFIFLLLCSKIFSQEFNAFNNIQFANYLTEKKLFKEAVHVLESQKKVAVAPLFLDSISYLLGNNYTLLQDYDKANSCYSLVSVMNRNLYTRALFKTGNNFVKLKKYDSATVCFNSIKDTIADTTLIHLKYFSLTSSALLKRDFSSFLSYSKRLDKLNDPLEKSMNSNYFFYNKIIKHKKKSPLLAGLLSSVIPGAGKFYAGKKGEAIGTFLPMAALGFLVVESHNKGGTKKLPFIGFTTLFSVFYISNIWGSVMSVNINKTEFNKAINDEITINMQLPFSSILR